MSNDTQQSQTLQGKVAIVTGASRGLGAEMALQLAKRGAKVAVCYTSDSSKLKANDRVEQIRNLGNGSGAIAVQVDLSSVGAGEHIVKETLSAFGSGIDILVNNAGVELQRSPEEITPDDFASVYNVNVRAPILLVRALIPHLRHPGRIINVSSVGARCGFKGLSLYQSSKAALEGLTRSWAGDLGVNGTTVNAIAPGPVDSEMLENIPKDIVESQKAATPVENRLGTPLEQAEVVCWLAGPDSGWVSGQVINVSGGWTKY